MYCSKCGVEQVEGSKFCHKCGHKIAIENEKNKQQDSINQCIKENFKFNNIKKWCCENKKKLYIVLGVGIIVIVALIGKYEVYNNTTEGKVKKVIKMNLEAMEEENVEKYMETVETSVPYTLKDQLTSLFQMYDLKYTIEDMKLLSSNNEEAEVEVVQVTKKVQGPQFNNNRLRVVHQLRQKDGKWKICDSKVKSTEHVK